MRLTELNPRWISRSGVFTDDPTEGEGVAFECPCPRCQAEIDRDRRSVIAVHFDRPLDGGPSANPGHHWQRVSGDSFETLTLSPSIDHRYLDHEGKVGEQHWHGFLRAGEIVNA